MKLSILQQKPAPDLMKQASPSSPARPKSKAAKDKLAAALRANLLRRKAATASKPTK